jgi:ParB-like chromosome segregation protein Spo0J
MLDQIKTLIVQVLDTDTATKIDLINQLKLHLHSLSPFKGEPVDCVLWVPNGRVQANDYNPNAVAPPEMELLHTSIAQDGYTQPIVTWTNEDKHEVVDGYHRHRVGKEYQDITERVHGYLPVVVINEDRLDKGDRMAATIRHNRARGKHKIQAMSEIVLDLKRRRWSDEKIAKNLGMEPDEVLRLGQVGGLVALFEESEFTQAWEPEFAETIDEESVIADEV